MELLHMLSGAPIAAKLILLVLALPLLGGIGVWAISLYGQTIPGNSWRDRRDAIIWSTCGLTLLGVLLLNPYWGSEFSLLVGSGIGYSFGVDGLRYILAVLAALLWLVASLFSRGYLAHSSHKMRYYFFFLMGETGILSVLLSADLYTMLTGFVLLNLACWVLTGHLESDAAHAAATRALIGTIAGALLALLGIFLLQNMFGTVRFAALQVLGASCTNRMMLYFAGALLLAGISIACAVWPLPKHLPSTVFAPGPAAALLAGAVTVAWLFSAMVLSGLLFWRDGHWGLALVVVSILIAIPSAIAAVFNNELKRTLSLLCISQTGLILLSLGFGCLLGYDNSIAAAAVVLQTIHHGLCQLVLFLCAGAVCMHLPDLKLSTIRGFGRGKLPLILGFCLGGASLCGMPLFFGSVCLTLLQNAQTELLSDLAALGENTVFFQGVQILTVLICGLSVAAMAKLLVVLFLQKNEDPSVQTKYDALTQRGVSPLMKVLLVVSSVSLPILGISAPVALRRIAHSCVGFFSTTLTNQIYALTMEHCILALLYLAIGGIVYLVFLRKRLRPQPQNTSN